LKKIPGITRYLRKWVVIGNDDVNSWILTAIRGSPHVTIPAIRCISLLKSSPRCCPSEGARRFTMKNMDLFEKHPGKMKEIIQLLFREFEEGMEFLSL